MTMCRFPLSLSCGVAAAMLLGQVACTPAGNEGAPSSAPRPFSETPAASTPAAAEPAAPAASSTTASPEPDTGLSKWTGYGDMRFGMDEAAFRNAWQGALSSHDFEEKQSCFHLWPKGQKTSAELAFMFGDTKFARYSTENPRLVAPGGGRIGMSRDEIERLYPGRVEEQPHKYTDGSYLRITEGSYVLIFETDKAGKVTEWRVGVPPFVDYVEGCA